MVPNRNRPPPIIDAALLLAVVALSVLAIYATDREYTGMGSDPIVDRSWSRWPSWVHGWIRPAYRLYLDFLATLGVFSLGLAVVAYRPRSHRLDRSGPGYIAVALAALLVMIWVGMNALSRWITPLIPLAPGTTMSFGPLLNNFWATLSPRVAWCVMAAWITLTLTGGWRRSADRTERLGRWLGWSWIGAYVMGWLITSIRMS